VTAAERAEQLAAWLRLLERGNADTLKYELQLAWVEAVRQMGRELKASPEAT
jgi:hypothetical protein